MLTCFEYHSIASFRAFGDSKWSDAVQDSPRHAQVPGADTGNVEEAPQGAATPCNLIGTLWTVSAQAHPGPYKLALPRIQHQGISASELEFTAWSIRLKGSKSTLFHTTPNFGTLFPYWEVGVPASHDVSWCPMYSTTLLHPSTLARSFSHLSLMCAHALAAAPIRLFVENWDTRKDKQGSSYHVIDCCPNILSMMSIDHH